MNTGIRYARQDEKPALNSLWEKCFPGEQDFTDYFFRELYNPLNALVYVNDDDRPVSMLHMLPYMMLWLEQKTPLSYVYGVGTHPDFRRRGLAARLIDRALLEMRTRGALFAALIPQQDWLFSFYRPFGFVPVCTQPTCAYTFTGTPRQAGRNDIPLLNAMYEKALTGRPHVLRAPGHWRAILYECALGTGGIWLDGAGGYAVFPRRGAPPTECFGPGARDTDLSAPFGCLRVIDATRAIAQANRAGRDIPSHSEAWDAATLTEFLFFENSPYMQLMHN